VSLVGEIAKSMSQPNELPVPPPPAQPVRPSDYLRMQDDVGDERDEREGSERGKEAIVDIVDQEQQEALVGTSVLPWRGCGVEEHFGLGLLGEGERLVVGL